uniref:Pyridoxal biosynthesis protein PDX1 n=1 Tax=Cajanus cajan TaxID=3821 RepID=A0A151RDP9_CAJCA|nr:putative pyridoxal biosynthesis protein PDX1 [Cajanus cajan]
MEGSGVVTVYGNGAITETKKSPFSVKVGLAQMLRGGVIMDVVNAEQARIAEEAGACAARIGHFVEAQILEAIGIDYVDESEVLTPADDANHINKHNFRIPFVCGCHNLNEALCRICEGTAMIRTKGEADTGIIIEALRHIHSVMADIRLLRNMDDDKLGCDGVFVGSGVFKSGDPAKRARAIVQAVTHYSDPEVLAEVSCGLGDAMVGINLNDSKVERFAHRSE